MTQDRINALESRQLELTRIMSASDAHAAKCAKLGLSFAETYPEDLAEYQAANDEYNSNEAELATLYEQKRAEDAEAAENEIIL